MNRAHRRIAILTGLTATVLVSVGALVWGFYAHREINRLAVYTLPDALAGFYKTNVEYVSVHAVDPDKRRYAASLEGPRHYIDMERFGDGSMKALPAEFWEFHDTYTALYCVTGKDSVEIRYAEDSLRVGEAAVSLIDWKYRSWYQANIFPKYRREESSFLASWPPQGSPVGLPQCVRFSLFDTAMQHGVLPYHLQDMQRWLTKAYRESDYQRVLQLSAELGHYIGDATVPLHTTENYNGQLTGQKGIHTFWESRIPELYAEDEFDLLVGGASYIADKSAFYRELVSSSHELVDSVLLIEADLRNTLPEDQIYCYEERLGRIVRLPCRGFTEAYYDRLDGMVEERFRKAILAVGSAWYTAWVDAGKPTLNTRIQEATANPDTTFVKKEGLSGRGH